MPEYGILFLVSGITNASANKLRAFVTSLRSQIVNAGNEDNPKYVINGTETQVGFFYGVATETTSTIRAVIKGDENPIPFGLSYSLWFNGRSYPKAEIETRMKQLMGQCGCKKYFLVDLNTDLTDMASKFIDL